MPKSPTNPCFRLPHPSYTTTTSTMGSLYEPSVRSSIWSLRASGVSKRFTTLEGWREIGLGVYAMGNSNIRMFSIRNQYDPEHFRDNRNVQFEFQVSRRTQPLKSRLFAVEYQRPSEATTEKAVEPVQLAKGDVLQTETRELYNVYTKKEKWVVVAIIGAAGIFPALTFNIYLPALTKIATVCHPHLMMAVNLTNIESQHQS
jgi:hypothetical protein